MIAGDFNFPRIRWSSDGGILEHPDDISANFLDTINSYFITHSVLSPTFNNNMLDLILSSDPNAIYDVTISAPLGNTCNNSLHSSLAWSYQIRDHECESEDTCRPALTKGDYLELNNYFKSMDWDTLLNGKNTNESYEVFLEHYNFGCSVWIPFKTQRKLRVNGPKWLTEEVRRASRLKFRAFAELRASSVANKPFKQKQFNEATRRVKKLVFLAIVNYENSLVERSKHNRRAYINDQKKCRDLIRSLCQPDGTLTSDALEIVIILNDQFYSAFSTKIQNLNTSPRL